MLELVQALGELAQPHGAWVRLHYVYPYPHVDEMLPLMASGGAALPRRAVPAQPPRRAAPDEASGQRRAQPRAHPGLARRLCPELVVRSTFIAGFPGETEAGVPAPAGLRARGADRSCRLLRLQPGGRRRGQRTAGHAAGGSARGAPGPLHGGGRAGVGAERLRRRVGATMQVLVDSAPGLGRKGGVGRSTPMRPRSTARCGCCRPRRSASSCKSVSSRGRASWPPKATTSSGCRSDPPKRKAACRNRRLHQTKSRRSRLYHVFGAQKRTRTSTMLLAST
jgi:ribosomal protein S12 methylthiotransferase